MCMICKECGGIMNYDPYFKAEICEDCNNMVKVPSQKIEIEYSGKNTYYNYTSSSHKTESENNKE